MAYKVNCLILIVSLIALSCAQSDVETVKNKETTTLSPDTSSTTITSSTPTQTTTKTTSTTKEPITTTTAVPSTVSPPPPPPPPTTVKPTPAPPAPTAGFWTYQDPTTKVECVLAQFAMQLNFAYLTNTSKTETMLYNLPINDTKVTDGSCGNDTNTILIQWGPSKLQTDNLISITFTKNNKTNVFVMSDLMIKLTAISVDDFMANQTVQLKYDGKNFTAPADMSYHCTKPQKYNLTEELINNNVTTVTNGTSYMSVAHVQLEAFHTKKDTTFSTAKDCDSIDTPDIVPIAVGCALAGLVIVVLIAYLVGRRRAQARGYLTQSKHGYLDDDLSTNDLQYLDDPNSFEFETIKKDIDINEKTRMLHFYKK